MLNLLVKLFGFFMSLWDGLSDQQKEKIIDAIVESFTSLFREYFQQRKDA
ncbi:MULTISPECIES: hypothetical protein [Enterobacter]|nr:MULTISPECIES: hypothetical protein [Enterobacter cloacae complex]EJC0564829.1 hypothetical protein [Enterobacter cloacae]MEB6185480.1 hypothetical protein [Enterobacter roggenkampii]